LRSARAAHSARAATRARERSTHSGKQARRRCLGGHVCPLWRMAESSAGDFRLLAGHEREPLRPVEEFLAVVGPRGGKSRALATFAAYISGLAEHPSLVPGERGVATVLAPRYQAGEHRARVLRGGLRAEPDLAGEGRELSSTEDQPTWPSSLMRPRSGRARSGRRTPIAKFWRRCGLRTNTASSVPTDRGRARDTGRRRLCRAAYKVPVRSLAAFAATNSRCGVERQPGSPLSIPPPPRSGMFETPSRP
jgi:hypothetical protein